MMNQGQDGFHWFIGVVEDIDDPDKLGRVKVRVLNEQNNLAYAGTDDLPWATCMVPVTASSFLGVGDAPVGIQTGAFVLGFYMDGKIKTKPMVLGSWPIIRFDNPDEHSVSKQARGDAPVQKDYHPLEPKTKYAAQYPYNRTINTKSGHVIEIDDTPKSERIHIYHRNGSYIEMNPDGSVVFKTASDQYNITSGNALIYSGGDLELIAQGSITLGAGGGVKVSAPGGLTAVNGNIYTKGMVGSAAGATGMFTTPTGKRIYVQDGVVVQIKD